MAVIIYGWGGVFREAPGTDISPTRFLCYKILYSLTFVQLKYPQVWKSSNQFYDAWQVRHFVTYFLRHVLCVGKCLLYVKFYSKEYSNKILKNILFRGPNLKMICNPWEPPFYHPIVLLLKFIRAFFWIKFHI